MLSVSVIGAGSEATGYAAYQENEVAAAQREDYYAGEGDVGRWTGKAAHEMSLAGELKLGQLLAGLQGFHPETGEALSKNAGEKHKGGWDLTFSAPKSVSCVWAVADPETRVAMEAAQNAAAARALQFLEESGAFSSRSRNESGPVEGVAAAMYQHGTSREADPQLHTHIAVLNVQPDGTAMDFDTRWKMAAGAVYRAELAAEMQKLGLRVEADGKSFRIVDVPAAVEKEFSTRRGQIEEALAAKGLKSAKAAEVAALSTRKGKEPTTRDELFADWKTRAAEHGFSLESIQDLRNAPRQQAEELDLDEILSKLTEQASTFTPQQLAAAVAVEMQGKGGADAIQKALRDLTKHPDLVRLESEKPRHLMRGDPTETRYTTREMLEIEQGILDKSQARQADVSHRADIAAAIAARPTMTDEQKAALKHVCEDPGAVKIIEGMAGTGKSYLMDAARESWEAAGFEVEGAALAGKAASGLESGADINSKTIHSLLFQLDSGQRQLHSKSILVIDEGGMVGSRQLARVLDHVHKAGAKAVMVGDSWQLQPIDAGGAFRLLSERLGAARLENIIRQKHEVDRRVVRLFADGKAAEALESMRERGLLKTTETRAQAMQGMVRDWAQARDPSKPGESIMLAATRSEVAHLNNSARQILKAEGRLAGGLQVPTAGGIKEFAAGDRIIFGKNNSAFGVKNGELGTVESIRFNKTGQVEITARHDNGKAVKFTVGEEKDQFEVFDYGYAMTVHKAQGVTVDRAFVLPSDSMSSREWAYVAMSRHRLEARMYVTRDSVEALTKTMSRAQGKETSLDFKLADIPEKSAAIEKIDASELATSHDLAMVEAVASTHAAEAAVVGAEGEASGLESSLSNIADAVMKARIAAKINIAEKNQAEAARHHGQQEMARIPKAVEQRIEVREIKKAEQQQQELSP